MTTQLNELDALADAIKDKHLIGAATVLSPDLRRRGTPSPVGFVLSPDLRRRSTLPPVGVFLRPVGSGLQSHGGLIELTASPTIVLTSREEALLLLLLNAIKEALINCTQDVHIPWRLMQPLGECITAQGARKS